MVNSWSIADKFRCFHSNILIQKYKKDVVDLISNRYKAITKRLNCDFWKSNSDVTHSLYVGSYGRDTAVCVSDIDVIFEMPNDLYNRYNEYQNNGQSALLQSLKQSISKTYSYTTMRGDGQVVVIDFSDGIRFEIVPVFLLNNGTYRYPDTNDGGSWKVTDPKAEIDAIKKANQEWNYNLKHLCHMTRIWCVEWNIDIGGLLIDTLAFNFLKNGNIKILGFDNYHCLFYHFFHFLSSQDTNQKYWLAVGSNQKVFRNNAIFESKAKKCLQLTNEAIEYEKQSCDYSANQKWKEIFGTRFSS